MTEYVGQLSILLGVAVGTCFSLAVSLLAVMAMSGWFDWRSRRKVSRSAKEGVVYESNQDKCHAHCHHCPRYAIEPIIASESVDTSYG